MYKRFERANESPHSLSHGLVLRLVEQSQTGTGRISRRPNVSGRGASYYYSRIKKQAASKVNIELILFAAYFDILFIIRVLHHFDKKLRCKFHAGGENLPFFHTVQFDSPFLNFSNISFCCSVNVANKSS